MQAVVLSCVRTRGDGVGLVQDAVVTARRQA